MNKFSTFLISLLIVFAGSVIYIKMDKPDSKVLGSTKEKMYWFLLKRESNIEYFYYGEPGDIEKSDLIKSFKVKTGVPGKKPTPLPQLLGRQYWLITEKRDSSANPETAPYFLKLNIPTSNESPFGPSPYLECGAQCDWKLPGDFGLHGVNGDASKMSSENEGSSGCIRHFDNDITYLFNILDPEHKEIRYYIQSI